MTPEQRRTGKETSDDQFELVLETALDAVVVMGRDEIITGWNGGAEQTFGWSRAEALGRRMSELLVPERLRPEHRQGLAHYLATGESRILRQRIETAALRRNGEEFPVELSITPLQRHGETLFIGFLRDISARKRSQAALEAEAQRARVMHQLTSFASQSASVEDALRQCLQAVCETIGWPVGHAYLPTHHEPVELQPSVWHCPPGAFAALREASDAMAFRPGVGLPGEVWQTKQPVWIADIRRSGKFLREGSKPLDVCAAFGFPITSGDQVIAVLEFFNTSPAEPDDNILLTARALGDQVGRVLERKHDAERQHALLAELNHRVKNMLAVVVGIATQTARNAPTLAAFSENFTGRLMSLSRTYSLMTSAEWQKTHLKDLMTEVLSPHADTTTGNVRFDGPQILLRPKMTLAMSMILHELLTNALKYGALSVPGGRIDISWSHVATDTPTLELNWREVGGPPATPPQKPGFGLRLIETSVRHELRGTLESSYGPEGVRHKFLIPWQGN